MKETLINLANATLLLTLLMLLCLAISLLSFIVLQIFHKRQERRKIEKIRKELGIKNKK